MTYPRLGSLSPDVLFLSLRDGKAGLGSDHLYLYRAGKEFGPVPGPGRWEFVGTPLAGAGSNPYVHGWDCRAGRLHVTWVWRGFVWYEGWDDPRDVRHKQQAGPNGAENNHDICYAHSDDEGYTWRNGGGEVVADLRRGQAVDNRARGIVAFGIPKGSGLMNQEAQAVDHDGGVHVLNRDALDGKHMWKHYHRSPNGMLLLDLLIFFSSSSPSASRTTQGQLISIRRFMDLQSYPGYRRAKKGANGRDERGRPSDHFARDKHAYDEDIEGDKGE